MTTYISSPDGKMLEAEPPLLKCLREYHSAVSCLHGLAQYALTECDYPALFEMECRLRGLANAMADDIKAATRETQRDATPRLE
jgi:hypothetical protein